MTRDTGHVIRYLQHDAPARLPAWLLVWLLPGHGGGGGGGRGGGRVRRVRGGREQRQLGQAAGVHRAARGSPAPIPPLALNNRNGKYFYLICLNIFEEKTDL